ncbi:MAG: low temperature requirement protein A [Actinobacteria bacterium]|nr:low temperature requirement protein A [Actinomycetota bacterium]
MSGLVFTYAHFPVVAGIATTGVGVRLAILSAGNESRYDEVGWVCAAGIALCMMGLAAIQLATPPTLFDIDVWLRLATAALALALVPAALVVEPLTIVWVLALAVAAQVGFELRGHESHHVSTNRTRSIARK